MAEDYAKGFLDQALVARLQGWVSVCSLHAVEYLWGSKVVVLELQYEPGLH